MTLTLSAEDRLDIQEVIARYAWALDTGDAAEFLECFAVDGELLWDAFEQPGLWRGVAQLREFIGFFRGLPSSAGRQHHVSNTCISATAEGATSRSYVAVAVRQMEGPHLLTVMGWYEDRFVRDATGRWRLRQRVIRDWSGPVLRNFAGQTGQRQVRERPGALADLFASADPT